MLRPLTAAPRADVTAAPPSKPQLRCRRIDDHPNVNHPLTPAFSLRKHLTRCAVNRHQAVGPHPAPSGGGPEAARQHPIRPHETSHPTDGHQRMHRSCGP